MTLIRMVLLMILIQQKVISINWMETILPLSREAWKLGCLYMATGLLYQRRRTFFTHLVPQQVVAVCTVLILTVATSSKQRYPQVLVTELLLVQNFTMAIVAVRKVS
ncbi:hypothetical protein BBD41_11425 [Paenibacillus ihbetae]|uniref:Uncharacterized protein n=1 Tax=Paenibacillus ihbetae TaxID=1870820 RepID=A0A1B2DZP6_9BACL|nr:hypothetical protein BBD41_11425 [Paenibacillus ihbetae]